MYYQRSVKSGTPIADIRRQWDEMVEDAKADMYQRFVMVLPQNARLESPLLHTSFTGPHGGICGITVLDNGYWIVFSRPIRTHQGGVINAGHQRNGASPWR